MKNNKSSRRLGRMFYNLSLLLSSAVIALVFIFMFIYTAFFSRTEFSIYDKELAGLPEFTFSSLFSGEYFSQLSKYFTDTVHNRDRFKENASVIQAYYGIEADEEHFVVSGGDDPTDVSVPIEDSTADESKSEVSDISKPEVSDSETSEPDVSQEPPAEEILDNIIILGSNSNVRAMEVFYYSEAAAENYAAHVNAFAAKLSGINVYSMVIPKQCAFYIKPSKQFGYTWEDSLKADTTIKNSLSGVTYVDAYHALEQHTSEEIYARTDHHWTALGAFYAAEEFAKTAGVSFAPITEYELNRRAGYVGTMYSFAPSAKLLNNPEDFLTLVPKASHIADFYDKDFKFVTEHDIFWYVNDQMRSGWYSTFLGGDDYMVKIKSQSCTNGRRLLVLKDSYGNALAPLLLSSFEEIYIADIRYTAVNMLDFTEKHNITDVLFAMCSYSAVSNSINTRIETITTQNKAD